MAKPENLDDNNSVILVDGSSYVYRAYHALPPLTTSTGQPTGAVRGVVTMVMRILQDHPNAPVGMVFDAKGDTFRHEMYEDYKANRAAMPDDLIPQIEPIHEVIKALGIKIFVVEGVEADDVIGTLAAEAEQKGISTIISTGDKDLAQLVTKNIKLVNTMKNEVLDIKGVEKKFGVKPEQIVDYLALVGDTSDNIPGVEKVGPKTAVNWLTEHNDIDTIIEKADEFKGKVGEYLRAGIEQLKLSRQLTEIKKDVKLDFGIEDLAVGERDEKRLHELFTELEFKTLLKEAPKASKPKSTSKYTCILDDKTFDGWLKKLAKAKQIVLDCETDRLDFTTADLVGLSFAVDAGEAAYLPFTHDYDNAPSQLDRDACLKKLKPILEEKPIIGQHIKFDRNVLVNYDIHINSIENDTMMMSYVLDSTATRHNLDDMANHYLNLKTTTFEEVAGKGVKQLTFNKVNLDVASDYAAEDADITLQMYDTIGEHLKKQKTLQKVLKDIELPLIPVLSDMEQKGTVIDSDILNLQSKNLGQRINGLEEQAFSMAGKEFNLSSPKQLQEILFDEMNIPVIEKTPGGQPSTAESVLQELAKQYELPQVILEHRTLSKLKSTYTDRLPEQISEKTGRVHSTFHQAVTTTGRLSSSDPNLQNIPIKTEEGRMIREAFVAPKGFDLISIDYSQIELRIMAHLSKDEGLITAFENGEDIHSATAKEVFGSADDQARRSAKAINFGLIYGMSAFGLGKALGVTRPEAADYIASYFGKYPGVKIYMDEMKAKAKDQGYVETAFGRRLYLPGIHSGRTRMAAERAAINAPMQGTAADIMKLAMINMHDYIKGTGKDIHLILQVHDEVIVECPEKETKTTLKALEQIMTDVTKLSVPLVVESGVANNWGQAH
ncbi:DNA polymerase I [SAR86 cluster bacterium]|nr:DNA polymerase I [SAR86 cluster bacterium]